MQYIGSVAVSLVTTRTVWSPVGETVGKGGAGMTGEVCVDSLTLTRAGGWPARRAFDMPGRSTDRLACGQIRRARRKIRCVRIPNMDMLVSQNK
eukprot:156575-Chlamydomonas_euryale.AAC.8